MCVNYCDFTRSKIGCPLKIAIFGCTDNTIFLCPLTTGYFAELKIHNLNWLSSKSERFEDCFFNCNSRYKHRKRWQFTEQMCCNGLSSLRSKFSRNHSSKSDKISFFIRKIGKMEKLKIEWKAFIAVMYVLMIFSSKIISHWKAYRPRPRWSLPALQEAVVFC